MIDKNKIIQAATKYVQKGQWDKAVKEYQKIIDADPKDIRILQKVGELHQKRGDNAQAAATFVKVAESYTADGFFLKAAAVYKQVLKLNPSLVELNFKLAELYQQLGLMSNALQQFQLVAAAYEQQGDVQKSLEVLKKLIELDPENAANRIRLAESYSREGMNEEAVAEFTKVAADLRQNNRTDEYVKVAERLAFLDPQNMKLCRELANVYLEKGDTKRALAKLQTCFKNDPRDIETLTLLAQAFKDLGQTAKTVSVYKELAKIYAEADRTEEEQNVWRDVLALAPDDPDALAWQGGADGAEGTGPVAVSAAPAPAREPTRGRAEPTPSAGREMGPEAVPKLLTEMNVYLKYGLHAKAAEHLKKLLAVAPNDLIAHEKAKELYLAMGDVRRAAEELVISIRLAMEAGERERAQGHLAKLLEVQPKNPEVPALSELVGDQVEVMELADDAILVETVDEEVAVEGEAAYPQGVEDADEAPPLGSDTSEGEVVQPAEEMAAAGDMTSENDIYSMEAEPPLEAAAEDDPNVGTPVLEFGQEGNEESENEATQAYDREALLAEAAKLSAPADRAEGSRGRGRAAPPAEVSEPSEVAETEEPEEFAEAEFFIEQQLWDEAEEALSVLRSRIQEFPHTEERLASLEQRLEAGRTGGETAPATAEEAAEPEGPFDLAAEIEKEVSKVGPAPTSNEVEQSFEEVVEELQQEADETVRPEDVETHYDLGIAYREMGLLDEAIGEFELAAKGASGLPREADCLAMVGDCLNGKGSVAEAAAVFERAGNIDGLSPETSLNLYFEIGLARERLADAAGALEAFERVASIDSTYRDVAEKLAKLKGSQRKMGYL